MREEILGYARRFGQVTEEELPVLESLSLAAEQELLGRLREGVSPADCGDTFAIAAAWLALSGLWVSRQAGDGLTGWSAGAVSLTREDGASQAQRLRAQAERLLAPYLREEAFYFRGVSG